MMRLILAGLWAASVATGTSYATSYWLARHNTVAGNDESVQGLEYKKTRSINVPMIADGAVQGYIVAQFIYTIDSKVLKALTVPPDVYILDEAFRMIYADDKLDFRKLDRVDLDRLTHDLVARVDRRLNGGAVKDILVQEFNYVAKEDVRR
jgi:hypothetical protein